MAWAQRQLDNGYLNEVWCPPCGQVASAASSSSATSANARSWSPSAQETPFQELRTATRTAWFKVFRPTGCGPEVPVDGAFVVDSFYYMKYSSGKQVEYLPKLLAEIRAEYGLVFVAVCSGGAALYNAGNGGAYFEQLLAHVPDGVRYVISVICGNDIYRSSFDEALALAI